MLIACIVYSLICVPASMHLLVQEKRTLCTFTVKTTFCFLSHQMPGAEMALVPVENAPPDFNGVINSLQQISKDLHMGLQWWNKRYGFCLDTQQGESAELEKQGQRRRSHRGLPRDTAMEQAGQARNKASFQVFGNLVKSSKRPCRVLVAHMGHRPRQPLDLPTSWSHRCSRISAHVCPAWGASARLQILLPFAPKPGHVVSFRLSC